MIGEIARVLRPGGLMFYDTINRTVVSKIGMIKVMQDWRYTAIMEPDSHVWDKFIKPQELTVLFERYGLVTREMRGIAPRCGALATLWGFFQHARGKLTIRELGRRLDIRESEHLESSYMGYAMKRIAQ